MRWLGAAVQRRCSVLATPARRPTRYNSRTMVTLHLVARVQADGTLELKTPTPLTEGEVEVTLLIQPPNASAAEWPAGYFDRLQG